MPEHDPLQETLHLLLRERADDVAHTRFGLDVVRGRARTIHRRRVAGATTAAALAVVALVVPTAMLVRGDLRADSVDPAGPSHTPSAIDTANPQPRGPLAWADLTGPPVIHTDDGSTLRPQVDGQLLSFAAAGDDRWLLQVSDDQGRSAEAVLIDDTGTVVMRQAMDSNMGLAGSDDELAVAWLDSKHHVVVLNRGDERPEDWGEVPDGSKPVEVVGCPDECGVVVNEPFEFTMTPYLVTADGASGWHGEWLSQVTDVSPDGRLATGLLPGNEEKLCWGLLDLERNRLEWRTCEQGNLTFSPDGSRLLATPPTTDGFGFFTEYLLDLDGGVLDTIDGGFTGQAWSTSTSWLTVDTASEGAPTTVVRHDLDGSTEVLDGPVSESFPFLLETR
ncbi:hypothetical protein [Nocardioides acrostichi]|uniref:WD40 repeat domain-containing protein n=1 Tax=Nocardioides acrostichi TaxID=2784339 RepID=A0A930UV28_9ACTN|nr:hypothetical protein [Nocardioides acrostichi]MBF4160152.1 hypothetical protein [Nocardioides acrostichi]